MLFAFRLSEVHTLCRQNKVANVFFGPSRVRALPLAAGINVGGHYFRYYSTLVVVLLPPLLKSQKGLS